MHHKLLKQQTNKLVPIFPYHNFLGKRPDIANRNNLKIITPILQYSVIKFACK